MPSYDNMFVTQQQRSKSRRRNRVTRKSRTRVNKAWFGGHKAWKRPSRKSRTVMPRSCFADPHNEKYPMCRGGTSTITCQGAQHAYNRARQQHKPKIAKRAERTLSRKRCKSHKKKQKKSRTRRRSRSRRRNR